MVQKGKAAKTTQKWKDARNGAKNDVKMEGCKKNNAEMGRCKKKMQKLEDAKSNARTEGCKKWCEK